MMIRSLCALVLTLACCAPALASPTSDVESAMLTLARASAFHLTITSHGKTGDVDIVPPSKAHIVFAPIEVIKIDNTTYLKMGSSWHEFTIPGMDQINAMYEGAIKNVTHPTADMTVVDLGMKTVDGTALHAYTFKNKDQHVPATVYIDAKGLPARMETSDGSVVTISNVNGPITIVAPI